MLRLRLLPSKSTHGSYPPFSLHASLANNFLLFFFCKVHISCSSFWLYLLSTLYPHVLSRHLLSCFWLYSLLGSSPQEVTDSLMMHKPSMSFAVPRRLAKAEALVFYSQCLRLQGNIEEEQFPGLKTQHHMLTRSYMLSIMVGHQALQSSAIRNWRP